jgi:hypothetical protein
MGSGRTLQLGGGEQPAVAEAMQPPIETAVDSATGSNPATPSTHRRTLVELSPTATSGALAYPVAGVGWQPSRFLVDRAEA